MTGPEQTDQQPKPLIDQDAATYAFRSFGVGGIKGDALRNAIHELHAHLGIDRNTESTPAETIAGVLLISDINSSLRQKLTEEGLDEVEIRRRLTSTFQIPEGEQPAQTFRRLVDIAVNLKPQPKA